MKRRCFSALLCSCCFSLSVIFSATALGINVGAEEITPSDPADIRSFYGDTIPFNYSFYGVEYTDSFSYLMTVNGGTNVQFSYVNIESNNVASTGYNFGSYDYIVYRCQTGRSNAYFTDVSLSGIYTNYSGYVRGGFGMSQFPSGFSLPTDTYNTIADYSNNYVGSNQAQAASSDSRYYNWAWMPPDYYGSNGGQGYLACRWNLFFSQTGFIVDDITFSGVKTSNIGDLFFVVMCPVYGGSMANTDPSQTTTSVTTTIPAGGTTVNVNVNVDMSETNGLLGQIKQGIDGIVTGIINGLKSLFIPSDDFMDDFTDDMEDLLSDHLGGLYEAEELIVDAFEELPNVTAKSEIYIEPVNIPVGETSIPLGGWRVPLKVSGLPSLLYDGIAFIIDFLCLAAFLRMCRNKLEIFLNPDSEVIQS